MHNYQPHQVVRIVTIQVAVPTQTDFDEVADYFSDILTGASSQTDAFLLDWQYVTLLDHSPVVTLDADPEEGDAFRALVDEVPACEASLALATTRTLGWWPDD